MFYTKAAKVIAGITLALGLLNLLIGFLGLLAIAPPDYLAARVGKSIDRGAYYIFAAALLGVLAEISKSLILGKGNEQNTH